jgi:hypothetical protein
LRASIHSVVESLLNRKECDRYELAPIKEKSKLGWLPIDDPSGCIQSIAKHDSFERELLMPRVP